MQIKNFTLIHTDNYNSFQNTLKDLTKLQIEKPLSNKVYKCKEKGNNNVKNNDCKEKKHDGVKTVHEIFDKRNLVMTNIKI